MDCTSKDNKILNKNPVNTNDNLDKTIDSPFNMTPVDIPVNTVNEYNVTPVSNLATIPASAISQATFEHFRNLAMQNQDVSYEQSIHRFPIIIPYIPTSYCIVCKEFHA